MGKRVVFIASFLVVAVGLGVGAFLSVNRVQRSDALPAEVLLLPADTVAVLGLDVRRVAGHPLYAKIKPFTRLEEFWALLESGFGHQPERDVDQAFLGCASLQTHGSRCLLILRGRFDAGRLASTETKLQWKRKDRGDVPTYTRSDGACLALLEPTTLAVATGPDLVQDLLAARREDRRPVLANQRLTAALSGLKPGPALWLVAAMESFEPLQQSLGRLRGLPDLGGLRALMLTATLDASVDLELSLEAKDEDTAGAFATVLRLALAALALQAQDQADLAGLTSRVSVTTEENRMQVRAQVLPDAVERALRSVR